MNLKSFPIVCRACGDKSIDVKHQTFNIKTKSSYSFEDCGTDGQTDGIDLGMYSLRPFE